MRLYLKNLWITLLAVHRHLVPFHRAAITLAIVMVVIEAHQVVESYLSAASMYLATHDIPWTTWAWVIVMFLVADELYVWLDNRRHWYVDHALNFPVYKHLKVMVLAKLQQLDLLWHHRNNSSAVVGKIDHGATKILSIINQTIWEFFPGLTRLVLSLPPMLYFAPWTALIICLMAGIFFALTIQLQAMNEDYRKRRHDLFDTEREDMQFAVTSTEMAGMFGQRDRVLREYSELHDQIIDLGREEAINKQRNYRWRNRIVMWSRLAIWMLLAAQCKRTAIDPPTMLFVGVLAEKIFYTFWSFNSLFDKAAESKEGTDRLTELVDEPIYTVACGTYRPSKRLVDIELVNVHFSYGENDANAVHDVSLVIKAGEIVALVGSSGAGKSTLQALITGQLKATSGCVKLDGVPIEDWAPDALEAHFSGVPQGDRVAIKGATVAANIAYSNPGASQEEIEHAAKLACAHDFILKKPKGYETLLGEQGVKLSGGEKQRVAIARAFLADRPFLLLDEPTSAVDVRNERRIQENLEKILAGRTVLITAHRLTTVRICDRIYVMKQGRIIEHGTHQELIAYGGEFAELATIHAS